jgi:hypothetical protein
MKKEIKKNKQNKNETKNKLLLTFGSRDDECRIFSSLKAVREFVEEDCSADDEFVIYELKNPKKLKLEMVLINL